MVKDKIMAKLFGAGSGSLLVLIINRLPDKGYKEYLLMLTPTISLLIISLVDIMEKNITNYFEKKKIIKYYNISKNILLETIKNDYPESFKNEKKEQLIELERFYTNFNFDNCMKLINKDVDKYKKIKNKNKRNPLL